MSRKIGKIEERGGKGRGRGAVGDKAKVDFRE